MRERSESKAVEHSCRIFRRLLILYPKAHREEYGIPMLQLFRDQCRDAWAEAHSLGLIGFWFCVLLDLLKTSILEHLSNLIRRKSMLSLFRPQFKPFSVFFPIFIAVFLVVILTSIVITAIYPETFAGITRVEVEPVVTVPNRETTPSVYDPEPYFIVTEFEVIESHVVLSKASEALNLRQLWGNKYDGGQLMNEFLVEAMIKDRLELIRVHGTKFIEIHAFGDSPVEAANLANGVAEAYRDFRRDQTRDSAGASTDERRVTILDTAMPDSIPVRPNKPLNAILGAFMGVTLGFIIGAIGAGIIVGLRKNRNPTTWPQNSSPPVYPPGA